MSRIDELIAEHCPDGVAFKALADVGELIRGRRFTKEDVVPVGLGSIHYGEIYTRYGTSTTTTFSQVRADLAPQLRFARPGDVVIAAVGETVEDVGKAVAWLGDGEVAVHDDCFIFRHSLNPKFVSYLFQTSMLNAQKTKYVARAKVKRLSGESLSKLRIPVPPAQLQREIVSVLDTFTELQAELAVELKAELEARRRQYEFYRDQVLTFTERERVRWVTLGEVFAMKAGIHITASALTKSPNAAHPYPCYGGNGVRGFAPVASHRGPHVLIGRQGALCGNVHRVDGSFYATEHAVVARPHPSVDAAWAFHMLTQMNLNQYATKSAQPGLAVRNIASVPLPLPPLEDQARFGELLDRFDALVNDLSTGLPAEIDARRSQYKHYRDRLLTFEEAPA